MTYFECCLLIILLRYILCFICGSLNEVDSDPWIKHIISELYRFFIGGLILYATIPPLQKLIFVLSI